MEPRSERVLSSRFRLSVSEHCVFFVIHHSIRELILAQVTAHPSSEWLAQQLLEACGISREPPRYLIHDRDRCFGTSYKRRLASLKIKQIRTPVKAPSANAIAERLVRTICKECLDHRLIFWSPTFTANNGRLHRLLQSIASAPKPWPDSAASVPQRLPGEIGQASHRETNSGRLASCIPMGRLAMPMGLLRPTTVIMPKPA